MATITGLTAARMLEIEAASVVDGEVVGDDLILTRQGGTLINAGSVRGPQGDAGPMGSDLVVVTTKPVLTVGLVDQIRAGRQLSASDFTNLGLAAPAGLWNLSNTNDSSGNGRNLTNKGTVTFAPGINGAASTAAFMSGLTTQVLYIADTGAADPFRIRNGSWGCWFRSTRKNIATQQTLISKLSPAAGNYCFEMHVTNNNVLWAAISTTGSDFLVVGGTKDLVDGYWHFGVATYDGSMFNLYVDGQHVAQDKFNAQIFPGNAVLNIGGRGSDAGTSNPYPFFGNIDEAFITPEVLSEDQIRYLYAAKLPHTLGATPKRAALNVRRLKKGAALVSADFPTQPLRLYNFAAGSLGDLGSNGQTLTNSGTALVASGADGSAGNAYKLVTASSQQLTSTDTGLPSGTGARSYGVWFKHPTIQSAAAVLSWGAGASTAVHALWIDGSGNLTARTPSGGGIDLTGTFVSDGFWHFAVVTEENAPFDSIKRKMYIDGRYVAGGVDLASITLAGASRFRIGHWPDGSGGGVATFHGEIDMVFVCGYVLSKNDVAKLYAKGAQSLGVSPKNVGDHVEAMNSTDLLCVFDTLPSQYQVDLAVA